MKLFKLFILIMIAGIAVACKKSETISSKAELDTIKEKPENLTKESITTFESISLEEYEKIINNYDHYFKNTILKRKNFEIEKDSFNTIINKYRNTKKFLDIYFVLDKSGENNLVFKFTNNEDIKPDYLLKDGDDQYIIKNKTLTLINDENLENLVNNYQSKYKNVPNPSSYDKFTILVRDKITDVININHNIILEPCINNSKAISLAFQMKNTSGTIEYFNRGALWP